jgi:hypothetical protein
MKKRHFVETSSFHLYTINIVKYNYKKWFVLKITLWDPCRNLIKKGPAYFFV